MSVVPFDPTRRFARPCYVLSRGKMKSGETLFLIDYLEVEAEGGGRICMWSGGDYGEALSEMLYLQRLGCAVHEVFGGVA